MGRSVVTSNARGGRSNKGRCDRRGHGVAGRATHADDSISWDEGTFFLPTLRSDAGFRDGLGLGTAGWNTCVEPPKAEEVCLR